MIQDITHTEPVPPQRIDPNIPPDIATIVLKAMEKESARRYASADELADDLQRFIDEEPIRARQTGPIERLLRWRRRQPALASMVALVLTVTVVGFAAVVWQWRSAVAARNTAQTERDRADDQKRRADERATEALRLKGEADRQIERADELLYASQIEMAQSAWNERKTLMAQQFLESTRPDLRGWEFGYLSKLFASNQITYRIHEGAPPPRASPCLAHNAKTHSARRPQSQTLLSA